MSSMASPAETKPLIQASMASPTESKPQLIDDANLHQRVKDEPSDVKEEKPTTVDNIIENMEKKQAETFKKYEAEFTSYLKAKYFSDKDIYGGEIFDTKTVVDGKTIKAGRFPGTKSYVDPAAFIEESSSSKASPASEAGAPTNASNGKQSGN